MERYVLLGLAPARATWFRSLGQWCHDGSLGAEFTKCVSPEELRARLGTARLHSAVLIDAGVPGLDRDLLDTVHSAGGAVIVVREPRSRTDWLGLGAHAVLSTAFDRGELLDALRAHALPVADSARLDLPEHDLPQTASAPVIAVCGPGGAGSSTIACCIAQGLATAGNLTVLADLCLEADQAMLHDAGEVGPGIQELVEAHRSNDPAAAQVRASTHVVDTRGYHLLLGLRRPRAWATLRPRAFHAAFESLRSSFEVVVCDTDSDVEGEAEGGSADVEDRNVMARTAIVSADVVFVVGVPGIKGVHSLLRVLSDVRAVAVDPARVIPVVNRAPRSGRARAGLAEALAALSPVWAGGTAASPLFVAERRVEEAFVDGSILPAPTASMLAGTALSLIAIGRAPSAPAAPQALVPGSLASWAEATG